MDPSIFKAYDVRGVYGEQLDGDHAYRIGRAFARVLGSEEGKQPGDLRVGLGRDMRLTAPEMAARYADGLRDEGADAVDLEVADARAGSAHVEPDRSGREDARPRLAVLAVDVQARDGAGDRRGKRRCGRAVVAVRDDHLSARRSPRHRGRDRALVVHRA